MFRSKRFSKVGSVLLFFILVSLLVSQSDYSDPTEISSSVQIDKDIDPFLLKSSGSVFSNFSYYKIISIKHNKIDGTQDLVDFPVLISIFDSDLKTDVQSDGADIKFALGNEWLDHEIDVFNQNYNSTHAQLITWIRIPSLKSNYDTLFYMYYGNSTVSSTENPSGVWQDYEGVYHLDNNFADSSPQIHDGTNYGSVDVTGFIGDGQDFESSRVTDRIDIGNWNVVGSEITIQAWFKVESFTYSDARIVSKAFSYDTQDHVFMLSTISDSGYTLRSRIKSGTDDASGTTTFIPSLGGINTGEWYFGATTWDGSTINNLLNGNSLGTTSKSGTALRENNWVINIGNNPSLDKPFDGILDEVRISSKARSEDWLSTEYTNQLDPDTFYSISSEFNTKNNPYNEKDYKFHKTITVDSSKVIGVGNHTDFPLLISLHDSDLHANTQLYGNDIAFAIDNEWLDHEIELFDRDYNSTHSRLSAWVRIPSLSSSIDTNLTMFFGNSSMISTENPQGVWNKEYQGVWHMNSVNPIDSSHNAYTGIAQGSMTANNEIQSQIGIGLDFDGSNDHLDFGDILNPTEHITMSAWIRPDILDGSTERMVIERSSAGSAIDYSLSFESDDIKYIFDPGTGRVERGSNTNVQTGIWQYFVVTLDENNVIRYFDDGLQVGVNTSNGVHQDQGSTDFVIGARYAGTSNFFNGIIDEVRISQDIHSDGWIETEYNNQFNPDTFYTVGPVNILHAKLTITCTDHDGNPSEDVNITLQNVTDPFTWDNVMENHQLTNSTGIVEFDGILKGSYTVIATYGEKYNNPIVLKEINISVPYDYEYILDNLNLTGLGLTLVYEGTTEPFYNAKVSFYEDNGTKNPSYIGYEISDENGNVSFYWLNRTASEMNYTFTVEKLGQTWPINSTENITVTMESFSEYFVEISLFEVNSYSTYLDLESYTKVLMNTYHWGEIFDINISYGYEEYPDENTTVRNPILDASVTYKILLNDAEMNTGNFNHNGSGGYGVSLDTDNLNMLAMGNIYILEITASKPGYDEMSRAIIIELLDIPMDLNPENGIDIFDIYWLENITVFVQLNDSFNIEWINDASLSFFEKRDGYIYGNLLRDVQKGEGWYNFTFNSSELPGYGAYTIEIIAQKENFAEISTEIFINILQVSMELNLESGINNFDFFWLENITVKVQVMDMYYSEAINDANLSYREKRNTYIDGILSRDIIQGDGWFNFTIDSVDFPKFGEYTIIIQAQKDNYVDIEIEFYINIHQIDTLINGSIFLPVNYRLNVTTSHEFYFNYTDSDNNLVDGAEFTLWELQDLNNPGQIISGILINTSDPGYYKIWGFNTSQLKIGKYSLITRIVKNNYVERQSAISLIVEQIPLTFEIDISEEIYSASKGNPINISFVIMDLVYNIPITNADVTIAYKNNSYEMIQTDIPGEYFISINTNDFDVFSAAETFRGYINIIVGENYTISNFSITIQVQPPLGPFGVPFIYWIIALSVGIAVISIYSTVRIVKYSNIPPMVKQINSTLKSIKRGKKFRSLKVVESKDEYMENRMNDDYSTINMSFKHKLTKKKN